MGNRAVITTSIAASKSIAVKDCNEIGVYLHWNGGRDSVEAFLMYCKLKGYRSPEKDCYGWARLCQVIGNFFGGDSRVGIDRCCKLDCDNWDNGTYIICDWEIVGHIYFTGDEHDQHDLQDMLEEIDSRMPKEEQLGKDFLSADIVPRKEVQIGDEIFKMNVSGKYELHKVIGIGQEGKMVNGTDVSGIPYVGMYGDVYEDNINNYLWNRFSSAEDEIRRKK